MQENDEREGPWRKILLSGGAILGAAAAYNAFARKGVDQLTNLIGGEEGGFDWRDRRVAFTKRGHGPPGRTNGETTSTPSRKRTPSTRSTFSVSGCPIVPRSATRRVSTSRSFPI